MVKGHGNMLARRLCILREPRLEDIRDQQGFGKHYDHHVLQAHADAMQEDGMSRIHRLLLHCQTKRLHIFTTCTEDVRSGTKHLELEPTKLLIHHEMKDVLIHTRL